jgi:hypothetical protein
VIGAAREARSRIGVSLETGEGVLTQLQCYFYVRNEYFRAQSEKFILFCCAAAGQAYNRVIT